jgi:hypothetical protein
MGGCLIIFVIYTRQKIQATFFKTKQTALKHMNSNAFNTEQCIFPSNKSKTSRRMFASVSWVHNPSIPPHG